MFNCLIESAAFLFYRTVNVEKWREKCASLKELRPNNSECFITYGGANAIMKDLPGFDVLAKNGDKGFGIYR